ncbi:hypothetical protein GCM10023084_54230 [Streptomyces lacrimifluminis]
MRYDGYNTPKPVKLRQWVIGVAAQIFGACWAVVFYTGSNSDGYQAGNWALVFCVPAAGVPLLYLVGLLQARRDYNRFNKAYAASGYGAPTVPKCEGCRTNPCSWNTQTSEWMDTCAGCRGPEYDNSHMIG